MKKIVFVSAAVVIVLVVFLVGCAQNNTRLGPVEIVEPDDVPHIDAASPEQTPDANTGTGGDFTFGRFRPNFYDLPGPFADLIGRDVYLKWILSRCPEERDNENVAVSFIRDFNISREAFAKANEQLRQNWESVGASPLDSSAYEIYPVDLIFTFDNELINEFFLWENSSIVDERGRGAGTR